MASELICLNLFRLCTAYRQHQVALISSSCFESRSAASMTAGSSQSCSSVASVVVVWRSTETLPPSPASESNDLFAQSSDLAMDRLTLCHTGSSSSSAKSFPSFDCYQSLEQGGPSSDQTS